MVADGRQGVGQAAKKQDDPAPAPPQAGHQEDEQNLEELADDRAGYRPAEPDGLVAARLRAAYNLPTMSQPRNNRRDALACIAEGLARKALRGDHNKAGADLTQILSHFTRKNPEVGFDWCAAFVYHCCVKAGFVIPARYPEPVRYSFAAVPAWLQWAKLPGHRFYFSARNHAFSPCRGDVVVFDNLLGNGRHDHIGIILSVKGGELVTAEGCVANVSGVFRRPRGPRVRGYIRIPNDYHCVHNAPADRLVMP